LSYDGRIQADARQLPLADGCVQCCVTSPPYWGLRDYGVSGQIGLEKTPDAYVDAIVGVFREVWRVLREDGTLWLNLGDSYAGSWGAQARDREGDMQGRSVISQRQIARAARRESHTGSLKNLEALKPKDLVGIPWRVAFALQADGWYLRRDIIWHKPNPMPESVTDRPTTAHEYLFLLTKNERYFYNADAIREPHSFPEIIHQSRKDPIDGFVQGIWSGRAGNHELGRNKRSVWTVATSPYPEAHYATFPAALIEPCILAGSKPGDFVLDPFAGSGTVSRVCEQYSRRWIGIDLAYQDLQEKRLQNIQKVLV
jgi:DNA modification methylase